MIEFEVPTIHIYSAYREGESIWCTAKGDRHLYRLDLNTMIMDSEADLGDSENGHSYMSMIADENWIFLIPDTHYTLLRYEKDTKLVKRYEIPQKNTRVGKKNDLRFLSGLIFENQLFLFGLVYPGIIQFDILEESFSIIDDYLEMFSLTDEMDGCFHMHSVVRGDIAYFPFVNANAILEFDMRHAKSRVHIVGDTKQRFIDICEVNGWLWMTPRDGRTGSVVGWNPDTRETVQYSGYPDAFCNRMLCSFYRLIYYKGFLYMFAHQGDINIKINIRTGEMEEFMHFYDVSEVKGCKYSFVFDGEEFIAVLLDREIVYYAPETGMLNAKQLSYGQHYLEQCRAKELKKIFIRKKDYILEDERADLKDWLINMKINM